MIVDLVESIELDAEYMVCFCGWSDKHTDRQRIHTRQNSEISFPVEDPSGTLTSTGGVWLDEDTYRESYTIADADT